MRSRYVTLHSTDDEIFTADPETGVELKPETLFVLVANKMLRVIDKYSLS